MELGSDTTHYPLERPVQCWIWVEIIYHFHGTMSAPNHDPKDCSTLRSPQFFDKMDL